MSKLTNISFSKNGAEAEQRFAKLVDEYLTDQTSLDKKLEDGTEISIRKQNFGDRGVARFVNLNDEEVGWEFVLYPAANIYCDVKTTGLKCSMRTVRFGESAVAFDSRNLDVLINFLQENLS